jgi:asparagine synthetase B (glutamine-hydrolysing)
MISRVLPDSTLPPECRTSAAEGIQTRLPYLCPEPASVALAILATRCVRDGLGKWPLREAARGLVPEEVRSAPKVARLAPSGGGSERARRRWLELFAAWLDAPRLAAVPGVDPDRARAFLDRHASERDAEARGPGDAVLLRLVSLAILSERAN